MDKQKYLTRYESGKGGSYTFCGWRLCVTRKGDRFVRYFSDLKCGGSENGLKAAMAMRDALIADLEQNPTKAGEVFQKYRRMGRAAEDAEKC